MAWFKCIISAFKSVKIEQGSMETKEYDYLLVGAGLFSAVFANELSKIGKTCLVVEKRSHVGGNLYCDYVEGIHIHSYGPHIFHTNDRYLWDYVNCLCEFKPFIYSPLACYKGELYNLPFNMSTFYQLWKTKTSQDAKRKIESQLIDVNYENLEDYALSTVGKDVYNILIKGYTEKQWGCSARLLPVSIIKRLPLRFVYNNNYFEDLYQGVPVSGYNSLFENAFKECSVLLNVDFLTNRELMRKAGRVIYTGMIDEYYEYCYGGLEYRSLRFEMEQLPMEDFQSVVAVNYTEREVPYTRIIEHKHFVGEYSKSTIITKEYPQEWMEGREPFYPVNTERNQKLLNDYMVLASREQNVYFAGRLGTYKYMNMDQVVKESLDLFGQLEN